MTPWDFDQAWADGEWSWDVLTDLLRAANGMSEEESEDMQAVTDRAAERTSAVAMPGFSQDMAAVLNW